MAYRITFVVGLFKGPEDQAISHKVLQILLDALYESNVAYLKANPNTPGIYDSGVGKKPRIHYEMEPRGQEDWKDIPTCLKDGFGDCEDLACWRAAELTVRHRIKARPAFKWTVQADGSYLYHIFVVYPGGQEDPSKKLGMNAGLFG